MSNNRKRTSSGRPSKFSPEFRRDAVAMVLDEDRPIADVGRAIGVNPGTLGNWVAAERVERGERSGLTADERVELAELRAIFEGSDANYGVPRMWRGLRRAGLEVNKKKVRRLMRLHGMTGRHHRRKLVTTFPGPDGYVIPDLVGRRFDPGAPDVAWCQDITYIPTGEGWLFLASVLDLGSRRLLGYSMAEHMRTELVTDALEMALAARGGAAAGVIAHADRGSQYTSNDYLDFCIAHQLRPSVGRTGICFDNAVAESLWASLKRECVQNQTFDTRAEARRAIFRWINLEPPIGFVVKG